jgi:hypothetical protein
MAILSPAKPSPRGSPPESLLSTHRERPGSLTESRTLRARTTTTARSRSSGLPARPINHGASPARDQTDPSPLRDTGDSVTSFEISSNSAARERALGGCAGRSAIVYRAAGDSQPVSIARPAAPGISCALSTLSVRAA